MTLDTLCAMRITTLAVTTKYRLVIPDPVKSSQTNKPIMPPKIFMYILLYILTQFQFIYEKLKKKEFIIQQNMFVRQVGSKTCVAVRVCNLILFNLLPKT